MLDRRLADRDWIAGEYSIADMACYPWAKLWERQGQDIEPFKNLKRWLHANAARPAVGRGIAINAEDRARNNMNDPAVRAVLFGQRSR